MTEKMSNIDQEMEWEIDDLHRRYRAKKQPILEAGALILQVQRVTDIVKSMQETSNIQQIMSHTTNLAEAMNLLAKCDNYKSSVKHLNNVMCKMRGEQTSQNQQCNSSKSIRPSSDLSSQTRADELGVPGNSTDRSEQNQPDINSPTAQALIKQLHQIAGHLSFELFSLLFQLIDGPCHAE